MSYNRPEIIAGDMEIKESFSCGCPTRVSGSYTCRADQ